MGKVEEKKERWYQTDFGTIRLSDDQYVRFVFNDVGNGEETLSIPLEEFRVINKFIAAESRRNRKEASLPDRIKSRVNRSLE